MSHARPASPIARSDPTHASDPLHLPRPAWLPGGHAADDRWRRRLVPWPRVDYRRERWDTPDEDFIDVDFALPEPSAGCGAGAGAVPRPRRQFAVALRAERSCARRRTAAGADWWCTFAAARANRTGCRAPTTRAIRPKATGSCARVRARWPHARLYAVGISLGGNMLAKWLGERGRGRALRHARRPRSARRSIWPPAARRSSRGFNARLHEDVPRHAAAARRWPRSRAFPALADAERDPRQPQPVRVRQRLHRAGARLPRHRRLLVARLGKPWLAASRVPHLVLNALQRSVRAGGEPAARRPGLALRVTSSSRQAAATSASRSGPFPGNLDFLPQRLFRFFEQGR
ncbi:MAG: hypothetical protein MZW92_35485 [Comamonadaceae bacterium]|nr:hypothetical protein [Comamonadaceae bacterium]